MNDLPNRLSAKYQFRKSLHSVRRMVQFGAVGGSGFVVDLAVFYPLLHVLPFLYARTAGVIVAMSWNYWLNRSITFRDSEPNSTWRQYFAFAATSATGGTINVLVSALVHHLLPTVSPLFPAAVGVIAGFGTNYVMCCRFVFRSNLSASESDHERR